MEIYRRYIKKYLSSFLIAVSCVFLEAMCDLMQPTMMARMIDEGVKSSRMETVIRLGLMMLGITTLGACFATTRNILASRVSQSFGADLRYDVFSKIMRFSEVSADRIESGSLITRVTNDTSLVMQFVNGMMRIFFKAPVTFLGSIIFAVLLSPKLSIILFLVMFVVSVFIFVSMKMSYTRFAKVQYAIDRVNTVVQEYLMGIRLVKAFGRFREEQDKFDSANTDLSKKSVNAQLVIAYFSPLISLAVSIGIAFILYFGSLLFNDRAIEVGKVSAFINYMTQILFSLIMITNIFHTFVRTKASMERINEVLNSEEDRQDAPKTVRHDFKELVFDNVTFAYPGGSGVPSLKNISFQVRRGETLAIIGPTGSGKSTVVWLCLRFYDVDQGAIYLNGVNIKEMDSHALRDLIAVAPQKSMLFTGTVFENITWGNPKATREEVIKAAQIAQADAFIQRMPEKYDSMIGQGGVNLSGGQKQRISIARALVKNSPLVILDDCTSALDAVTEAKVRQGLKNVSAEKTVVIITQRIGTAMFADKILVLNNGENVGFGSHEELLESCETYREIYNSQIGGDLKGDIGGRKSVQNQQRL